MDRENDNSPGGRDQPNATPAEGVVAPVPPPRPAVPAAYWQTLAVSEVAPAEPLMRDPLPAHDLTLPLPMVPSQYGLEDIAQDMAPVEPPRLRPSVAATLPPPRIDVLDVPQPVLRVTTDAPAPIDASRLTLAPEAHVPRVGAVSFGRDPVPVVLDRGDGPITRFSAVSAVLPSPAQTRLDAASPIKSVPAAPSRIEPVFAPQTTKQESNERAVAPDATVSRAPERSVGSYLRTAAKYAVYAAVAWLGLIAFLIFAYRFVNPPMSSLMLQQWISGQAIAQTWADIDEISPQVVRAVLLSEDGRFCDHTGVDFDAMQDAIERAGDGAPRGASTISMQVVKNLFLWPSKSYIRKAIEIPLTWAMELVWPKRRIMEIYLNIAEWGPGIFGVEAASQFHFQKSARRLNEREAAQLAVSLPNPYMRDAGDPGPKTRRLAGDIQSRMRNAYASQTSCVLRAGAGR